MFKFRLSSSCSATLLIALSLAAPAHALSDRAFVSGHGTDAAGCGAATKPCRTLQFVHDSVIAAGGEIDILDSAGYGPVTIAKALSIVNDGATAGVQQGHAGRFAITINAAESDAVSLRGLTIDGLGTGSSGIVLNSGGSLTITHCFVRNFAGDGILLLPTVRNLFVIADTVVSDNSLFGVFVNPQPPGSASGTLDHVVMSRNGQGGLCNCPFDASVGSNVTAVESTASNSIAGSGFAVARAFLQLAHSTAVLNHVGVDVVAPATAITFGDNHINENDTNVSGVLTAVGTQ